MKTLFLLGILITLTVIAVKKPNQTAFEAAGELSENAHAFFSTATRPKTKTMPAAESIIETIGSSTFNNEPTEKAEAIVPSIRIEPRKKIEEERQKKDQANIPSTIKTFSAEPDTEESPLPILTANAPPTATLPELPPIPATPVLPHPISSPSPPQSTDIPDKSKAPRTDYVDVKVFYENASRLLEEIK